MHNATHTMELARPEVTLPSDVELAQAHADMSHGLATYNAKQFKRGYAVHDQACNYYLNQGRESIPYTIPLELRHLCSFGERTMYGFLSKKHATEQDEYNAETYRSIQDFRKKVGLGLMSLGTACTSSSAFDVYQTVDDDTASWWQPLLFLKSAIGVFATYSGLKLSISSHKKSQQAEAIVARRKREIAKIHMYVYCGPEQA